MSRNGILTLLFEFLLLYGFARQIRVLVPARHTATRPLPLNAIEPEYGGVRTENNDSCVVGPVTDKHAPGPFRSGPRTSRIFSAFGATANQPRVASCKDDHVDPVRAIDRIFTPVESIKEQYTRLPSDVQETPSTVSVRRFQV